MKTLPKHSIEDLRIYEYSRKLESEIHDLIKKLPPEEFYPLGNNLQRSAAAIAHYITEGHKRYSLGLKLEAIHLARTEAQQLGQYLDEYSQRGYGDTESLSEGCTSIIRQAWGLIRYFKRRQASSQQLAQIKASDALANLRR